MKTRFSWIIFVLVGVLALAGCAPSYRVGELQSESQTVELEDAESVRVEIKFGAGNLKLTGGAEKLLEADFNYNVAQLKPEVDYKNGTLYVRQPGNNGLPNLVRIGDFQNEWGLRLYDQVPMDLSVVVGGGSGDLQLAGLSLTRLDVNAGAGQYSIDLSGDWSHDLDVAIDAGAADISLRLPGEVGVRVVVEEGPHSVYATGLMKDGTVYTNDAYGVSPVTVQVNLQIGIGQISLDVADLD